MNLSCKKVRYRDKLGALIALSKISRSKASKREECRHYKCPNCHGWHLTSQQKRRP